MLQCAWRGLEHPSPLEVIIYSIMTKGNFKHPTEQTNEQTERGGKEGKKKEDRGEGHTDRQKK